MLVDLTLRGKSAVVIGDGPIGSARAEALDSEGARVTVLPDLPARSPTRGGVARARGAPQGAAPIRYILDHRPAIVFSTLGNPLRYREIFEAARSVGALIHVYDTPALSDFTLPSVGGAGAIRLAVSTGGQSPAMAAVLRRKLEHHLRPEDVLLVRLQSELRPSILETIPTFEVRRDAIYQIA